MALIDSVISEIAQAEVAAQLGMLYGSCVLYIQPQSPAPNVYFHLVRGNSVSLRVHVHVQVALLWYSRLTWNALACYGAARGAHAFPGRLFPRRGQQNQPDDVIAWFSCNLLDLRGPV